LILESKDTGLKVEVEKAFLDRLYTIAMEYYPSEFGGILVGRYSEDRKTCIVCDTILAKEYKSSKYYFERGRKGLNMKLKAFYNQEPQLIYVGEWHTHPDMPAEPSGTDKQAMQEIEAHDDINITSPLLLIISSTPSNYSFNCFVQHKKQIHKYGK